MGRRLEGLGKGQIWRGKDNAIRLIKSIVGEMVSYDVRIITSSAYQNSEFIEKGLIDAGYFQRNCSIHRIPSSKSTAFYDLSKPIEELLEE